MINSKLFVILILTASANICFGCDGTKDGLRADFKKHEEGRRKDDARRKHDDRDKQIRIERERANKARERAKAAKQAEQAARKLARVLAATAK